MRSRTHHGTSGPRPRSRSCARIPSSISTPRIREVYNIYVRALSYDGSYCCYDAVLTERCKNS
jgi:hypothetical protein